MDKRKARATQSGVGLGLMLVVMAIAATGYRPDPVVAVVIAAVAAGNIGWVIWTAFRKPHPDQR